MPVRSRKRVHNIGTVAGLTPSAVFDLSNVDSFTLSATGTPGQLLVVQEAVRAAGPFVFTGRIIVYPIGGVGYLAVAAPVAPFVRFSTGAAEATNMVLVTTRSIKRLEGQS